MALVQLVMAVAFALPCFLMAARLWRVWRDPLGVEGGRWVLAAHSVVGMILYLGMVGVSLFVPLPRFGITAQVAAQTRVPHASGMWIDQPHRAIGAATGYFLLLGLAELLVMTWIDPRVLLPG